MCSDGSNAQLQALGFPIRKSTGQRLLNASPWLIAVVHVLHRLQVPRHPPCALTILTVIPTTPLHKDVAGVIPVPTTRTHTHRAMRITCCVVFKGRRRANQPQSGRPVPQNATARTIASISRCRQQRPGPVNIQDPSGKTRRSCSSFRAP